MAKSKRYDDNIYIYKFIRKKRTENNNGLPWGKTPVKLGKCMSYPYFDVPWPEILRDLDRWDRDHDKPSKNNSKVISLDNSDYERKSDQIYYNQYIYGE